MHQRLGYLPATEKHEEPEFMIKLYDLTTFFAADSQN